MVEIKGKGLIEQSVDNTTIIVSGVILFSFIGEFKIW